MFHKSVFLDCVVPMYNLLLNKKSNFEYYINSNKMNIGLHADVLCATYLYYPQL